MFRYRLIAIVLVVVSVGHVAAGCGESTAETTATVESGVVFGRGSVPKTVPDSFPIPEEAVVGAADINRDHRIDANEQNKAGRDQQFWIMFISCVVRRTPVRVQVTILKRTLRHAVSEFRLRYTQS